MLENILRPKIQKIIFDPIAKFIYKKFNITANMVTLLSAILGILTIPLIALGNVWLSILLIWLSGIADVIDGSIARISDIESPAGIAYDIVSDRIVEFSLVLGLYLYSPSARGVLCMLMMGSILICVTSFLVVAIIDLSHKSYDSNCLEKSFYYSPGLIERFEAFIFISLMIIFPNYFNLISIIFITAVTYTTYQRMIELKNHLNS